MAASTFPPLYNLSQHPEDQASLGRIKAAWDDFSSGWDQETKITILSRLHEVRATLSNRRKPSDHKLYNADFNFGIWVMIRCIYPTRELRSLKARLVEMYPWIDQGFQAQIQDYIAASSSDNDERMIKPESGLAPVFTQPRPSDGLNRQQDPSFSSLRPVQSLFPSRQNVIQPAAAHPPRANLFPDVNPRPPAGCVPRSDSFSNFLKRKADEDVLNTPSKRPGVSATRAASPVGFGSRSSFLDDELDRQVPNVQPGVAHEGHHRSYDAPKECCKLYHERRNAEFREVLEQTLQRMQADLKTLVQRYSEDMKREVNPLGARQQQQHRRNGDGDLGRDAFLESLDARVTRLEEVLRSL
ncbi:uncharacterized protein NECHADRAFT_81803 [Fusarium vanettenii 77-13-4]|uniref:Uncharacterized protein n=1 Tax=Fusarium vanettenii (strain ATCC MYA-4622 / CBS 123669 / FGSC 9596 / NRRL 45880 / 77-13-4) TaxID=660122 RepID=C7Z9M1_FUSV7|nr:uncharacterized protein NECHADRAFT_81803 [Fusarium vanettenii 77-13-4]EEU39124.1 predicted protein [Fusarium vanettenii 77-13-4]